MTKRQSDVPVSEAVREFNESEMGIVLVKSAYEMPYYDSKCLKKIKSETFPLRYLELITMLVQKINNL
ncbi:hypothetical protein BCU95_12025 [Vibrio splendidus]|nr:hypothetical protein BCU95_12025 [Vibrio splendidus]